MGLFSLLLQCEPKKWMNNIHNIRQTHSDNDGQGDIYPPQGPCHNGESDNGRDLFLLIDDHSWFKTLYLPRTEGGDTDCRDHVDYGGEPHWKRAEEERLLRVEEHYWKYPRPDSIANQGEG
jgi:hypothetical protein